MRFLAADAARVLHIANCQEAEVGLLRRLLEGVGTAGEERAGRATLPADVGKALWQLTFRQLTLSVFEALAVPKRGDANLRKAFELLGDPKVREVVGAVGDHRRLGVAIAAWDAFSCDPRRAAMKRVRDRIVSHRSAPNLYPSCIQEVVETANWLAEVGEQLIAGCIRWRNSAAPSATRCVP